MHIHRVFEYLHSRNSLKNHNKEPKHVTIGCRYYAPQWYKIRPNWPSSLSSAVTVMITVPMSVFSGTRAVYVRSLKNGALSFVSVMRIWTSASPGKHQKDQKDCKPTYTMDTMIRMANAHDTTIKILAAAITTLIAFDEAITALTARMQAYHLNIWSKG